VGKREALMFFYWISHGKHGENGKGIGLSLVKICPAEIGP
jgi:hypothetical protein